MTGEPQATDRAAVVAGITAKIEELLGADPGAIKPDEPLGRQVDIDSLDAAEIAIALEEMLFADDTSAVLDLQADWTIDRIADDITDGTKVERKVPDGMDAELQGQHAFHNEEPISNNPFIQGTENFVLFDQGWKNAERAASEGSTPATASSTDDEAARA